jgi:hypothetical protein
MKVSLGFLAQAKIEVPMAVSHAALFHRLAKSVCAVLADRFEETVSRLAILLVHDDQGLVHEPTQ